MNDGGLGNSTWTVRPDSNDPNGPSDGRPSLTSSGFSKPDAAHKPDGWLQWFPSTLLGRITLLAVMLQAIIIVIIESVAANQFIAAVDISRPGPARGVPVYLVIFIFAQLFQIVLAWDAIVKQNTMQIGAFVGFNLIIVCYSIFQYAQLINLAGNDPALKLPLIVIPFITGAFQILFFYLASKLYYEFGWTIFKRIGADPVMRSMYRSYQIFVLLVKVDVFFVFGFGIQFLVLVIRTSDPEFALTIAAIPIMLLVLATAVYGMRTENKLIVSGFLFGVVLAMGYFIFKIVRIYTQPAKYSDTKYYLTFFAALSLLMVISTFVVAIQCILNFGKGLKTHLLETDKASRATIV